MDRVSEDARAGVAAELELLRYRPVDWFLLSGNRLVVSAGLLAVVAGVLWWVVLTGMAPLTERTPILFLLFALISGNFTLIAIVVSISQFVLSRHLESPGEIRDRMRETATYRQEVGEITGEHAVPVTPEGFFLVLFRGIERGVGTLLDREWDPSQAELRQDIEAAVAGLDDHAAHVVDLVEGSDAGIRYALFSTLDTNYSRYFYGVYWLRSEYGGDLPASVEEDLARLERYVEHVDVARRYFKTVLIQSELSSLSRLLLYIGIPVQLATVVLTLLFTASSSPAITRPMLSVVIPLIVTAGFAPIILLTVYILRLATVVQRTAAMYPFTTRYRE